MGIIAFINWRSTYKSKIGRKLKSKCKDDSKSIQSHIDVFLTRMRLWKKTGKDKTKNIHYLKQGNHMPVN